jgi:mannose-binding lectin 2
MKLYGFVMALLYVGGHRDISVQVNDGTKSLQMLNDETKIGCDAAMRYHEESAAFNPVHSAARIKVKVVSTKLAIEVDEKNSGEWKACYEGVLPFSANWLRSATLGISAATGGVADNHDILRLASFEDFDDKDFILEDSVSSLHKLSKDFKTWLESPSCQMGE